MHRRVRFLEWAARAKRRPSGLRQAAIGLAAYRHRLVCESLEDRRLLSATAPQIDVFNASPALFAQNEGQWTDQSVRYAFNGSDANILFTDAGLGFQLYPSSADNSPTTDTAIEPEQFTVHFTGGNQVAPVGLDRAKTVFNYFVGDQSQWKSDVATYQTVAYNNLYTGIDLDISGQLTNLKYEFHVAAGADYQEIQVRYAGIEGLSIDAEGALHIQTKAGELVEDAPYIYQEINGQRIEVAGQFALVDDHTYAFQITGTIDSSRALVIDPDVSWSANVDLQGNSNSGYGIAVDTAGDAYVTGFLLPYNSIHGYDVFVAKLGPGENSQTYVTYLGGSGNDYGNGIAIDAAGNACVTGSTVSSDFLTTPGALDRTYNGGSDAFVAKFNASGSVVYSTYLGGSGTDYGNRIAMDTAGNAYVTGETDSRDFPTTTGAFDPTYHGTGATDAFVTKLDPTGSNLVYSTYLGGSNNDDEGKGITVDAAGNAYVTGTASSYNFPTTAGAFDRTGDGGDAFVAKLNARGSSLVYSTYLGGNGSEHGTGIAIDTAGNAYVTGYTNSSDALATAGAFDTTYNGNWDVFVAKLSPAGSSLLYATYLGGSAELFDQDYGYGIAVDTAGCAYVTGSTECLDFPTTAGAFVPTVIDSSAVFVTKLNASGGGLAYSTYLKGSYNYYTGFYYNDCGCGIAVDAAGTAYVTGFRPYSVEVFVATIIATPAAVPSSPTSVVAASGDAQLAVTWVAPASTGGSPITNYLVKYSSDGGVSWTRFFPSSGLPITALACTVTGLTNGTPYVIKVIAQNAVGISPPSANSVPATPSAVPSSPTSVVAVGGNAELAVTWVAPASTGGSPVTNYLVKYSSNGGVSCTRFFPSSGLPITALSCTVTGLANGTPYLIKVNAQNAVGISPPSANSAPATPAAVPSIPTSVIAVGGNAQLAVTWAAPASNGGSPITNYLVKYSSNGGVSWTRFFPSSGLPITALSCTITGLANGTPYLIKVNAQNAVGISPPSANSAPATPLVSALAPTFGGTAV